jgi:hypothetical protein
MAPLGLIMSDLVLVKPTGTNVVRDCPPEE